MPRRRFIAAGAAGTLSAPAGCSGFRSAQAPPADGTPDDGTTSGGTPAATPGVELPAPGSELRRGAPKDAIPAITDPLFGTDWSGIEVEARDDFGERYTATPRLHPDDGVVGVERDAIPDATAGDRRTDGDPAGFECAGESSR